MSDLALPLTQSEAFERTCSKLGLSTTRISTADGTCLIQTRKLPLVGAFHLISRGPVLSDPAGLRPFLRQVRRDFKGPLVMNSPAEAVQTGGIKLARGAELAITDLIQRSDMRARLHQKWRNQLKKAEASQIVVTDQPLEAIRHKWFLDAEAAQQTSQGYKSYPSHFLLAYSAANKGQARVYTALRQGRPVAAMLVLKHGLMATYQAGVTTPEGRAHCAHNLILWQIMCDLPKRRVQRLDLGRADLSPGLRRFKLGSGATIETLAGSFLFHHWFAPKSEMSRPSEKIAQTL